MQVTRILFLRAVNLGRTNKVPMKLLVQALEAAGLGSPSYLLQSGNVVVAEPTLPEEELERATERLILVEFGVSTVAIGRTPQQLAGILEMNPYTPPEGGSVHVAFLAGSPRADLRSSLQEESFSDAHLTFAEREVFIRYGGSTHTSKLSNALIERRLKVASTSRNVRTLERLLALPEVSGAL